MTNDGLNTLVYDAENHVTSATNGSGSGTYTYDGNGQRIKKIGGGNTIVSIFAGAQALAEYYNGAAPTSPTNEYIYAGNLKIASIQSGTTDYWHNDHLSPRVRTDTSGNVADQRGTFPFGETWYPTSSTGSYMFTTYYRDGEAEGNDYAQARTYVGGLGRFSSPDPVAGSTSDPQSLNRYSYVRNLPTMLSDPFGTCPGGTVQNRDANQSEQTSGSGPSADGSNDSANPEPQTGIGMPCTNSPLPGGWDDAPFQGGGWGGAAGLDGGYNGDDSGFGVGSPLGYGGGIGAAFDVLALATSPTGFTLEGDTSADCLVGFDCSQPQEIPVYGNLGLLDLINLGGPGSGPGGPDGGATNGLSQLRLVVKKDCLDLNGRWINYSLVNTATGAAPTGGQYTVTENINDGHVENSDIPNTFNDWQGSLLPGMIYSTIQSFTVTGPGATNVAVPVRGAGGKDYGALGIWRKGNAPLTNPTVLINGQSAPIQMPLGKLCDNDRTQ